MGEAAAVCWKEGGAALERAAARPGESGPGGAFSVMERMTVLGSDIWEDSQPAEREALSRVDVVQSPSVGALPAPSRRCLRVAGLVLPEGEVEVVQVLGADGESGLAASGGSCCWRHGLAV